MKKKYNGNKAKTYTGKNIRISDEGFEEIKTFVEENNYKLGKFAEAAILEKIDNEKEKKSQSK